MTAVESSCGVGEYLAGETAVLWRRADDTRTTTRRAVHMHHGYNASAVQYLTTYRSEPTAFAAAGLPTLTGDDGGLSTWGNDTVSGTNGAVDKGATWLLAQAGVKTDKLIGYGGSMGCLDLLNWIKLATGAATKVSAVVLVLPAVDLQDLHDNRQLSAPGDIGGFIETAYGGHAAYLSALATHNPAANAASFSAIPMLLCYTTDDPIAVPSVVTAFASAVGSSATLYNMGTGGHSSAGIDFDRVRNWLVPYL